MKGSHPRPADGCPFVLGHSQVRLPLSCSWECYENVAEGIKYDRCSDVIRLFSQQLVLFDLGENMRITGPFGGNPTALWLLCFMSFISQQQTKHHSSALLALDEGNLSMTGRSPSQRASNAESVSMPHNWRQQAPDDCLWWRREPWLVARVWYGILLNLDSLPSGLAAVP